MHESKKEPHPAFDLRQILPAPNPQRGPRVPRLRGGVGGGVLGDFCKRSNDFQVGAIHELSLSTQYGSVKEISPLRQAGGAGDAGEAGGEKKAYLNRIA
ncbi:hypothetical protein [Nostoc sp. ChiQUE01b]|uniref:hypothetical protein n=1 Tax=Nostoc sp. ChiQUE01b TaxID=3075376 RepID=UPI002AD40030|nr:hypothetical protein [Nostoc sp. ChiQUE01b]MDZ8262927.1 hypothetical protein [Nostoc sp. ChiQUE01b]